MTFPIASATLAVLLSTPAAPAAVGLALALLVGAFARLVGLDRDRSFYPTVLVVVASYYVLFALMAESLPALLPECLAMGVFVVLAVVGLKRSLWVVVGGLAAHGLFDLVHAHLTSNPGVPAWWPAFCLSYDVGAAGWLAWLGRRDQVGRRPSLAQGCPSRSEA